MIVQFSLIDYTTNPSGDITVFEEPQGWSDLEIVTKRDEVLHGFFIEYSLNQLITYDPNAINVLQVAYENYGIDADVQLLIEYACSNTDSFTELYRSQVDFRQYELTCGNKCSLKIGLSQTSVVDTFLSRQETKVDLDASTTLDGSAVTSYTPAQFRSLPSQPVLLETRLRNHTPQNAGASDILTSTPYSLWMGIIFDDAEFDDLGNTVRQNFNYYAQTLSGFFFDAFYNQDGHINIKKGEFDCLTNGITNTFNYNLNFQGILDWTTVSTVSADISIQVMKKNKYQVPFPTVIDFQLLYSGSLLSASTTSINWTSSGTVVLNEGDSLFIGIFITNYTAATSPNSTAFTLDLSTCEFDINIDSECASKFIKTYAINETLSRVVESITDNKVLVRSDYYGRTDSEPYDQVSDGDGSLRMLTRGEMIRSLTRAKFQTSFNELFNGLNAIDCIGAGFEPDPDRIGELQLRIEPVEHFYDNTTIFTASNIPDVNIRVDSRMLYQNVKIGYQKYEIEQFNGLDEFNTERDYRLTLKKSQQTKTILSNLIASGYAIETQRRYSDNSKDFRYDNDTFIIQGVRSGGSLVVAQGQISLAVNIYNDTKRLNFNFSPVRNLMRWAKLLRTSYRNADSTPDGFVFTAATGNYQAEGLYTGDTPYEDEAIAENENIVGSIFLNGSNFSPLFLAETITFTYPLSLTDYQDILSNPYGLIEYSCRGSLEYGYIRSLKYNFNKGLATFELITANN